MKLPCFLLVVIPAAGYYQEEGKRFVCQNWALPPKKQAEVECAFLFGNSNEWPSNSCCAPLKRNKNLSPRLYH
jgi:hypothetical protein